MNKKEAKVNIKLERHRWPDEIAKEKRRKKIIWASLVALLVTFFLGWQSSRFFKGNTTVNGSEDMQRFELVYQDVLDHWYFVDQFEKPQKDLIDNAIKGMLDLNGDKHTAYLTEEESNDLTSSINRDFEGIGVQYYAGDLNVVTRVFKNSPAETSGVLAGDILHKVDGVSIEGKTSEEIQALILGESGTQVQVEFIRNQEPIVFEINRGKIQALAWGEILDDNVGYIEVSSFGSNLADSMKVYLDEMIEKGVSELIIDLRDNGGGYLHAIQEIAPIFFEDNDIVYQEDYRDKSPKVYTASGSEKEKYSFDSIVLLLNENSASASEVLAIAMRENLKTQIVGVTSYGKGTIQMQKKYPDRSSLKITMAKWLSPSGQSVNEKGIEPDFEVRLPEIFYSEYVNLEEHVIGNDQVHEAVAYVQKGLHYLNYHDGRIDGYYDNATKTSLSNYLKDLDLEENTDIDQEMLKQVYSSVVADWSLNRDSEDIQLHKAIEVVKNGS